MVDQSTPNDDNTPATRRGTGKLTTRLCTFAREYYLSGNATDAARKAGYSEKSAVQQGSRLLTYENVQAELRRLEIETAERFKIDRDFFVRELLENHRVAHVGTPILSRNGDAILRDGVPLVKCDLAGSNKALELLARVTGEMADRRDEPVPRTAAEAFAALDNLTEEELAEEQAKLEAKIARLNANDGEVVPLRVVGDNE